MVQKTYSGTLDPVDEDDQVEFGFAVTPSDQRHAPVLTFGPTPPTSVSVYNESFNTARSSIVRMVDHIPTSETALLSTFHDQQNLDPLPPLPESIYKAHLFIVPVKKSNIVYIKSDDNAPTIAPTVQNGSQTPNFTLKQWGASAKRHISNSPPQKKKKNRPTALHRRCAS